MSYDVELKDADGNILFMDESFEESGTYAMGGTTECTLNITYNYSEVYGTLVKDLHGQYGIDSLKSLKEFVDRWPHAKPYDDYWAPTPGNAVKAIKRLVSFAEKHPNGVWHVS